MTVHELLSRLEGTRPRGQGRWSARCPAHDDQHPSLSIAEGERGVLVTCWAGCTLHDITAALGLEIKDLFFATTTIHGRRPAPRPARINPKALAVEFELAALDRRIRAECIFQAVKHLGLDTLPAHDLDRLMEAVGRAYADCDRADLLEGVADDVRAKWPAEARRDHAA